VEDQNDAADPKSDNQREERRRKPAERRIKFSLGSIVGQATATLGLIAILIQISAYRIASEYYRVFGIEPSSIGVTMLNASLRLGRTAEHMTGSAIGKLFYLVMALVIFFMLHSLRGAVSAQREMRAIDRETLQSLDELYESSTPEYVYRHVPRKIDPRFLEYEHLIGGAGRVLNRGADKWERVNGSLRDYGLETRRLVLKWLPLAVATTLLISTIYKEEKGLAVDANRLASSLIDGTYDTNNLDSSLNNDLRIIPVTVQWKTKDLVPKVIAGSNSYYDSTGYDAYLISQNSGRVVLYVSSKKNVVNCAESDLIISYHYGDRPMSRP
jgi:hypothetical protein